MLYAGLGTTMEVALLCMLSLVNAALAVAALTLEPGGVPFRLMSALACAVLPIFAAVTLARLSAKDQGFSTKSRLSPFQINLEIIWTLSLIVVGLVELAPMLSI